MNLLFECLIVVLLLIIVVQDFKDRAVSWILFPILILLFSLYSINLFHIKEFIVNSFINVLILSIQVLFIIMYFSLRNRRFVNITSHYLGWGDIIFLFSICFLLPPLSFLFFYLTSLAVTLVVVLFIQLFFNLKNNIPLAGIQSSFLVLLILLQKIYSDFDLTNDSIFYNFFF